MKFPLKVPILLISNSDVYLTSINYAGKDYLTCSDIYKKYILKFDDNVVPQIGWVKISNNVFLRKDLILGYSNLENQFLLNNYNTNYKDDIIFENENEETNEFNNKSEKIDIEKRVLQ